MNAWPGECSFVYAAVGRTPGGRARCSMVVVVACWYTGYYTCSLVVADIEISRTVVILRIVSERKTK